MGGACGIFNCVGWCVFGFDGLWLRNCDSGVLIYLFAIILLLLDCLHCMLCFVLFLFDSVPFCVIRQFDFRLIRGRRTCLSICCGYDVWLGNRSRISFHLGLNLRASSVRFDLFRFDWLMCLRTNM